MYKLTAKQERFVAEYLIDLNATQAAIRAGYAEKGASVEGTRLLANAKVAAAVAAAKAERCKTASDYNPNAVLKGAELLGRHLAMFTDNKTVI